MLCCSYIVDPLASGYVNDILENKRKTPFLPSFLFSSPQESPNVEIHATKEALVSLFLVVNPEKP